MIISALRQVAPKLKAQDNKIRLILRLKQGLVCAWFIKEWRGVWLGVPCRWWLPWVEEEEVALGAEFSGMLRR